MIGQIYEPDNETPRSWGNIVLFELVVLWYDKRYQRGAVILLFLMKTAYYRVRQFIFKLGSNLLDWSEPAVYRGPGSVKKLPLIIKNQKIDNVLIVTDETIVKLGLMDALLEGLGEKGIRYAVYDGVQPNPVVENVEEACRLYFEHGCGAFIAFGGGSPMDCAKVAAAKIANPGKSVKQMRGLLLFTPDLPEVFAVPTTAGTGSETTIAAVISDRKSHEKYSIFGVKLRPRYAILDPELTIGLPPNITAGTGMDALIHAIEAYIGQGNTKYTTQCSLKAVRLVYQYLERAYQNGGDIEAREQMLIASNHAGNAFTRAYVGYIHAIAHNFGGIYNTPHGLANAIVMPYVLEYYGSVIHRQLAELADAAGVSLQGQDQTQKAEAFLAWLKELRATLGIPEHLDALEEKDIPLIVERTLREANPLYPVPKIMDKADCEAVLRKVKG